VLYELVGLLDYKYKPTINIHLTSAYNIKVYEKLLPKAMFLASLDWRHLVPYKQHTQAHNPPIFESPT
jgi:hypothetical protein